MINRQVQSSQNTLKLECLIKQIDHDLPSFSNVPCTLKYNYISWDENERKLVTREKERYFFVDIIKNKIKDASIAFLGTESSNQIIISSIAEFKYSTMASITLDAQYVNPSNKPLYVHSSVLESDNPILVNLENNQTATVTFNWKQNIKAGDARFNFSSDTKGENVEYSCIVKIQPEPIIEAFGINKLNNHKFDPFRSDTKIIVVGTNLNLTSDYAFSEAVLATTFSLMKDEKASSPTSVYLTVAPINDKYDNNINDIMNLDQISLEYNAGGRKKSFKQSIEIRSEPRPYPLGDMIYIKRRGEIINYKMNNSLDYQYSAEDDITVHTIENAPLNYGDQKISGTIKILDESMRLVHETSLFSDDNFSGDNSKLSIPRSSIVASSGNKSGKQPLNLITRRELTRYLAAKYIKPGYKIEIEMEHDADYYDREFTRHLEKAKYTIYVQHEWVDKIHYGLTIPPVIFSLPIHKNTEINTHPLQAGFYCYFRGIDNNRVQKYISFGIIFAALNIAEQDNNQPNYVGTISEDDPPILNVEPIRDSDNEGIAGKGDYAMMFTIGFYPIKDRFPVILGFGYKIKSKTHVDKWFVFLGLGVNI